MPRFSYVSRMISQWRYKLTFHISYKLETMENGCFTKIRKGVEIYG